MKLRIPNNGMDIICPICGKTDFTYIEPGRDFYFTKSGTVTRYAIYPRNYECTYCKYILSFTEYVTPIQYE